jgi:hypothetical protein
VNTEFTSCDHARNTFTASIRIHLYYIPVYFILLLKSFHNNASCPEHIMICSCYGLCYVSYLMVFFSFPLSQRINSHAHQILILKIIYNIKAIKSEVQYTSYVHCTHRFSVLESPKNTMNNWKIFSSKHLWSHWQPQALSLNPTISFHNIILYVLIV